MSGFLKSIRFTIALAFSVSALLLCVLGAFCISGLAALNGQMRMAHESGAASIVDLAKIQAAALDTRLRLRSIQTMTSDDDVRAAVDAIRRNARAIDAAFRDYYPARVASDEERAAAQRVGHTIPAFASLVDAAVQRVGMSDYAEALQRIEQLPRSGLGPLMALNERKVAALAEQGEARFERFRNWALAVIASIADAATEQSRRIAEISVALAAIDTVTQQNAALVEQAAAGSQALEHEAVRQKELVGVFRS